MIFEVLLFGGFAGMVLMAVMGRGLGRHGHGGGHGHSGHGQFGHGHAAHGHGMLGGTGHGQAHAVQPAHGGHQAAAGQQSSGRSAMVLLPTPIDVFSAAMGIGAVGCLLSAVPQPLFGLLLGLGGFAMVATMRAISKAIFAFASEPSAGVEGLVGREATVLTAFNDEGKGLVQVTLDGQLVQLLASLPKTELGIKVPREANVTVLAVDPNRGSCTVTTEFHDLGD